MPGCISQIINLTEKYLQLSFRKEQAALLSKYIVPNTPCYKEPNDNDNKNKSAAI